MQPDSTHCGGGEPPGPEPPESTQSGGRWSARLLPPQSAPRPAGLASLDIVRSIERARSAVRVADSAPLIAAACFTMPLARAPPHTRGGGFCRGH